MNVNAGIETTMLVIFGVMVLGLGIVGVLRTRRKLRHKARMEADQLDEANQPATATTDEAAQS